MNHGAERRKPPLQLISAFSWFDTRHIGDPGPDGRYRRTMLTSAHTDMAFAFGLQAADTGEASLGPGHAWADSALDAGVMPLSVWNPVEALELARVPDEAGLEIAARYRPAGAGAGSGGDWYGILPLPDGRLLFTVGDIAGHGFAAATAMAQLVHALQGLALTGADSAQLLRWLNAVTCSLSTFTIASACVALYDPADRRLHLANAGHPNPVLVRAGEAAVLPGPAGLMLGVDEGSTFDEKTVVLKAGDVLLLYTDGLIERRRHSPDENISRLLAEASACSAEPDLDCYVDRILERGESDTGDDTCILAVRFH